MTTSSFSQRFGYSLAKREEILEDAPTWLRQSYNSKVLGHFVRHNLYSSSIALIASWEIERDLVVYFRLDTEPNPEDNSFIYQYLFTCDWYHFYDFVEFISMKLQEAEDKLGAISSSEMAELVNEYGSAPYRDSVNYLFSEAGVGWRMNDQGLLRRVSTKTLDSKLQGIDNQLTDEYAPAREHYRKAVRYVRERPLDPENAIKEVVSAIESAGRVIYPESPYPWRSHKRDASVQVYA